MKFPRFSLISFCVRENSQWRADVDLKAMEIVGAVTRARTSFRCRGSLAERNATLPSGRKAQIPIDYPVSDRTLLTIAACLALLILGCVWLLETMHNNSILEDCLMAGRRNCSPIAAPPQVR